MSTKECSHCGYVGKPVHDEYSSILLDVFAWGFGFIAAFITSNIYLAVFGPLVSVWHLFTFRSHRCPKCGNWDMHRIHGHHGEGMRHS